MKVLLMGIGNASARSQFVSSYPENYIQRNMNGHEIITFGYNEGVDIKINSDEEFSKVMENLPSGWLPDVCILWNVEWYLLPVGIEYAPFPLIAFIGDWDYDIPITKAIAESVDLVIMISDYEKEAVKFIGANNAATYYPQGVMKKHLCSEPKKMKNRKYDILYTTFIDDEAHLDRSQWILRLCSLSDRYKVIIAPPYGGYDDYYIPLIGDSKLVFSTQRYGSMPNRFIEGGGQGSVVIDTGVEANKYFLSDEEFIMINEKNYADKIDQHLNDLDRLQILSDNIYRKVAKDYEAEKRFTEFISFIDNHLKDYHNSGRYYRRSCSLNKYEMHIRRGEVFYYSFFRSICIENKDSKLLERSIEEFKKAIVFKATPRGMTDLAVAKASYIYLFEMDKIDQSKVQDIINILEDIISSYPEYAMAYFNLGLILMRVGKSIEALKTFYNALEVFKNQKSDVDPWCLYNRDYDLFNKIIRKPLNANLFLLHKGKKDEALQNINHLYKSVIFYFISLIEREDRNAHKSLEAILESHNLNPESGLITKEAAELLSLLGFKEESLEMYKRAIRLLPLNVDMRIEYAKLLYSCQMDRDAINEIKEAYKITKTVLILRDKSRLLKETMEGFERFNRNVC